MGRADPQAETARTRGTPLTPETFLAWRKQFTSELKQKREKEEEERIKALPPREREDVKKRRERLSGGSLLYHSLLPCPSLRVQNGWRDVKSLNPSLERYTWNGDVEIHAVLN